MLLYKSLEIIDNTSSLFVKNNSIYVASVGILQIDIETGINIKTFTNNFNLTFATSLFVNEQYIFAGFESGHILQLEINTGYTINVFQHHSNKIEHLWVSNNILLSRSQNNLLLIYDITNKKVLKTLESESLYQNFIIRANFLYYVINNNQVVKYNFLTDKIVKKYKKYDSFIINIFIQKNDLMISLLDKSLVKLNILTGQEINNTNMNQLINFLYLDETNENMYFASKNDTNITHINFRSRNTDITTLPNKIANMIVQDTYIVCSLINGLIHIYKKQSPYLIEEDTNIFINKNLDKKMLNNDDTYYKDDNIHCTNNNVFTLEPYTKEDEPIQIYTLNNQNKFEISTCITIDEITHHLTAGKNTLHPSMLMSICTPQSHATGKIIISLPPNNLFYTYGSIKKLLSDKKNKTWFALPLFGDKKRRVGNLDEAPLIGSLHCQIPGYKVYKLYTLNELNSEDGLEVVETLSDYPEILYDYLEDVFDLKENITKDFINKLLDSLF